MKFSKHIVILATALMLGFVTPAALAAEAADPAPNTQQAKGSAQISFAEKKHDFGNIAENGGPVTCEFVFTNTGDAPLVIVSATASCGCTQPKFPAEPVKPGKTGKITVKYLPQNRPGEFDKTIKVRTNAKNAKKVSLRISGTVIPAK